jgi:hypothetical protein
MRTYDTQEMMEVGHLDCGTLIHRLYIEGCFSGNVVFKQGYLFVKTGGRFSKRKRYDQRFHEQTIITDIVHFLSVVCCH